MKFSTNIIFLCNNCLINALSFVNWYKELFESAILFKIAFITALLSFLLAFFLLSNKSLTTLLNFIGVGGGVTSFTIVGVIGLTAYVIPKSPSILLNILKLLSSIGLVVTLTKSLNNTKSLKLPSFPFLPKLVIVISPVFSE